MPAMLRKALMIVPLSLLFAAACLAQTGAAEGVVLGPDGKPVQGAVIKIERQEVKGNYSVKTDRKGHFFHGGLPPGPYQIVVSVDGQDRAGKAVRVSLGDAAQADFKLDPAGAAASARTDDSTRRMTAAEKAALDKVQKENAAAMAKNKDLNDAFNAGKQAMQDKQWDAAVTALTKASEVGPTQHVVWGNLAEALSGRAGANATTRQTDFTKAVEAFQKAIELKPDDPAYHNNYALVLAQQKKFDEAQAELTKAAQIDPPNGGKYYFNLGAVYVNTGNLEPAAMAFKKATDLDPKYAEAHYQQGVALLGMATVDASGKMTAPAGTADAFKKYLELRPTGENAESAKAMLASMSAAVSTSFTKK